VHHRDFQYFSEVCRFIRRNAHNSLMSIQQSLPNLAKDTSPLISILDLAKTITAFFCAGTVEQHLIHPQSIA